MPGFAGNNRVAAVVHPGGPNEVASATRGGGLLDGFFSDGKPGNDRARDALQNPAFGGRTPGGFEGGHPGQGTERRSDTGDDNSSNVEQNPHLGEGSAVTDPDARFLYYVHTDHLGSTNYVTDPAGELYQHLQYFPFGETWVEQRTEFRRIRHLFTGKELDAESGLYYFGARYYDPRTSVWVSTDPALGDYLPNQGRESNLGIGGIRNSSNLALYAYGHQNPFKIKDPDGNVAETAWDLFNLGLGAASFGHNVKEGNYGSAAVDAGGVVVDAAATVIPFVPGGAGAAIKTGRGVGKVVDTARSAEKAGDAGSTAKGGTYKLRDPETGEVRRTGRTNDLGRRQGEHGRDPNAQDLEFEVDRKTDDYAQQRGREQEIYEQHPEARSDQGGLNKRRPVSPRNKRAGEYRDAAKEVE